MRKKVKTDAIGLPKTQSVLFDAVVTGDTFFLNNYPGTRAFENAVDSATGDTLLHVSLKSNQSDIALILLDKIYNVNKKNNNGLTPLHLAVPISLRHSYFSLEPFHDEVIKKLLEKGADPDIEDNLGNKPLYIAIQKYNPILVGWLLKNTYKINSKNKGLTPLQVAISLRPFGTVASQNRIDIVRQLLEAGANADVIDCTGSTPLHYTMLDTRINQAGVVLDKSTLLDLILCRTTLLDVQDKKGDTALHIAVCAVEDDKSVKKMLDKGANPDLQNAKGQTPLHNALLKYRTKAAELLADKTKMIHLQDCEGRTTLNCAACSDQNTVIVKLLERGADANIKCHEGNIPLHWAVRSYNKEIPEMLLKKTSNVNAQTNQGWTPLHFVTQACSLPAIKCRIINQLLDEGADINMQDYRGNTPLHIAAMSNTESHVIGFLLERGALFEIKNIENKKAFDSLRYETAIKYVSVLFEYVQKLFLAFTIWPRYVDLSSISDLERKCVEELIKMKHTKVYEDVCLNVIFSRYRSGEPYYLSNSDILSNLETIIQPATLHYEYPIYKYILKNYFEKSKVRYRLLVDANVSLCNHKRNISVINLPDIIKRKILSYLTDKELLTLIMTVDSDYKQILMGDSSSLEDSAFLLLQVKETASGTFEMLSKADYASLHNQLYLQYVAQCQ